MFCLHPRIDSCIAGNMCHVTEAQSVIIVLLIVDCGMVLSPESVAPPALLAMGAETGSRRPPVTEGMLLASDVTTPPDACLQEWSLHIRNIQDQPKEVVDGALEALQKAYHTQPVTGGKARALVLVSLLWASRRLHGNNQCNDKYLFTQLKISPKLINKAFKTGNFVCSDKQKSQKSTLASAVTVSGGGASPDMCLLTKFCCEGRNYAYLR